jgi:hypothetical protein
MMERLRFSMAKSAATQEATDTCEAAAAPVSDDAGLRQADTGGFSSAGNFSAAGDFSTANAVSGEWRVIRNRAGEC